MALKTKCIKVPPHKSDGLRISIMRCHTKSDGVTPDPQIRRGQWDGWWRELAPPETLLGDYNERGLSWDTYQARFRQHIQSSAAQGRLQSLVSMARLYNVTIMGAEATPERCHRRVVAEACLAIDPQLTLMLE